MEDKKVLELKSKHTLDVHKKMLLWLESGEHYDCTILAGPTKKGSSFKCHRLTLAAASPALERMLYGHFEESKKGIDDPISLPDVTSTTFKAAMRFVYGKDTSALRKDLALTMQVLEFATKWQISVLDQVAATLCFNFELAAEDLLILHNLFSLYSFADEKSRIEQIICSRGSEVLASLAIAHKDTVQMIFKQESINVFSEKDFLDGLVKWGAGQIEESAGSCDNEAEKNAKIRAKIGSFLGMVRFESFTTQDMAHLCKDLSVLSNEEKLKIFTIVQLQEEVPQGMKGFDLTSGWRGKFKHETGIVSLSGRKNPIHLGFGFLDLACKLSCTLVPSSSVYLLSVGIYNLCHSNQGLKIDTKIELLQGSKILSTTEYSTEKNLMHHLKQRNSMIRLVNPCLLEGKVVYTLAVTHHLQLTLKSFAQYTILQPNIQATKGITAVCQGSGDICALEFAAPAF